MSLFVRLGAYLAVSMLISYLFRDSFLILGIILTVMMIIAVET